MSRMMKSIEPENTLVVVRAFVVVRKERKCYVVSFGG